MEDSAPDLQSWLRGALGQRVYTLERKLAAEALAQVFGWQLLQIGQWGDDDGLLAEGRTQRKAVLAWHGSRPGGRPAAIRSRTDSLAIASDCVDAVVLPHTLEYEPEPHEILREVGRILSAEGHLIVLGFEIVDARRYLFTLPWGSSAPSSQSFFERTGQYVWPMFAGGYLMKARKRVYTLTPIRPRWRLRPKVVGGLIEPTTRGSG